MSDLLAPEKNIIIVSGPAGSGKDTLIDHLLNTGNFTKIITTTSRPRREHEAEGLPYSFVSKEEFETKIQQGSFIEHSQNENGEYYGIQKKHFEEALQKGKKIILKVDWKGVLHIKETFPLVKSICIMAPLEILIERMHRREGKSYTEEYFKERIEYAKSYFTHLEDYDYVIWNNEGELQKSIEEFETLVAKITST